MVGCEVGASFCVPSSRWWWPVSLVQFVRWFGQLFVWLVQIWLPLCVCWLWCWRLHCGLAFFLCLCSLGFAVATRWPIDDCTGNNKYQLTRETVSPVTSCFLCWCYMLYLGNLCVWVWDSYRGIGQWSYGLTERLNGNIQYPYLLFICKECQKLSDWYIVVLCFIDLFLSRYVCIPHYVFSIIMQFLIGKCHIMCSVNKLVSE